jgi:hypothetical protein
MAVSQPPVSTAGPPRTGHLSAERWARYAPLTGIAAVVLFVAGGIVSDSADSPDESAPAAAYLAYFENERSTIYASTLMLMVGVVFLLWFAGALRSRLAAAEGGDHRLASTAFAGAIGVGVLLLASLGPGVAGAFTTEEDVRLTPDAAQALYVVGDGFFFAAWYAAAVLLLASAVAILRTGAMAGWLGWASLAMGVLVALPWIGWAVFIFLLPLWIVAVAVMLFRDGSEVAS